MQWKQWLILAKNRLSLKKIENPNLEAEILLKFVTKTTRSYLLTFDNNLLSSSDLSKLEFLLKKRELGYPIAYLLKIKEFWSLSLNVSSYTFIPRNDTECIIEFILKLPNINKANILDLGTGSGAIALAIASELPQSKVTGVDFKKKILKIAKKNANKYNIKNVFFIQSNWFNSIKSKKFNIIVSNPPYLKKNDLRNINNNLCFEPYSALVAGNNGLKYLTIICSEAKKFLTKNGWLILEHGYNQGNSVRKLMYINGFNNINTILDYSLNERISYGQIS